jgi:N-acyl-D-aspartate/D-glutamate deacylase
MNIIEFIEQESDVEQLSVKYKGKQVEFYVKNLSQAEIEEMNAAQLKLKPIYDKQQKGEDLEDEEARKMFAFQSDQAFNLLCDSNGNRLFNTADEMRQKIKGKLFKAIADKITEENKLEEAEKN